MKIHFYCVCWNEEKLIPYFLRYYRPICEKIVVYDNMSDDNSRKLLSAAGCEMRDWQPEGDSVCIAGTRLKATTLQQSRDADWVIIADMDEFIFCKEGLTKYLEACKQNGTSIVYCHGYDMISWNWPTKKKQLYEQVRMGIAREAASKTCIFDPSQIESVEFTPGCHKCVAKGNVVYPTTLPYLLHYRYLGYKETWYRFKALAPRLLEGDVANEYGRHYMMPFFKFRRRFRNMWRDAAVVPPLKPSGV